MDDGEMRCRQRVRIEIRGNSTMVHAISDPPDVVFDSTSSVPMMQLAGCRTE